MNEIKKDILSDGTIHEEILSDGTIHTIWASGIETFKKVDGDNYVFYSSSGIEIQDFYDKKNQTEFHLSFSGAMSWYKYRGDILLHCYYDGVKTYQINGKRVNENIFLARLQEEGFALSADQIARFAHTDRATVENYARQVGRLPTVGEAKLFTEKTEKDADVSTSLGESSPSLSPSAIAAEAGVSVATIYNYAKTLGRLPTIEEVKNWPRKKSGRKPKYT